MSIIPVIILMSVTTSLTAGLIGLFVKHMDTKERTR